MRNLATQAGGVSASAPSRVWNRASLVPDEGATGYEAGATFTSRPARPGTSVRTTTYSTGMKTTLRNVDTSMPPNTAVPTEWRPAWPAPRGKHERQHAEDERQRGHQDRPEPDARRLERGIDDREPFAAQLLGELDDQDRVLRGQADEHDEADLAVHVVLQPAQALRADAAEHGERHAQQDDERQHQALVLRREREVHEQQREAEDVEGLPTRLQLLERLAGPLEA